MSEQELLQLFEHERRYIRSLAFRLSVPCHWRLNPDDVEGELFCLMVRIWRDGHKHDRRYIHDQEQFIKVFRASAKNWVKTLRYHELLTYRRDTLYAESIEEYVENDAWQGLYPTPTYNNPIPSDEPGPEKLLESKERMAELEPTLSELQKRILDVLLGNDRMALKHIKLESARKDQAFRQPTIRFSPRLLSRILGFSELVIKSEMAQMRKLLAEVA